MKLAAILAFAYGALADFEELPPGYVIPTPPPKTCDLAFTSGSCSLWGDPHTNMFNGKEHDIMGQPMKVVNGEQLNGLYYVARCNDWTVNEMPVQIIGVHYPWTDGDSAITGVDYFTLELSRDADTVYYLYFSTYFQAFASSDKEGVSFDYDKTKAANPGALTTLQSGVATSIGALGRYSAHFTQINGDFSSNGHPKAEITLTIDGEYTVYISLQAQQIWKTNVTPNRRRMHEATIQIDDEYRCATCGLCGSFKKSGYQFEKCDGSFETIADGYDANHQPWAFWQDGVSYEFHHYNDNCGVDDHGPPPDNVPGACTNAETTAIKTACENAKDEHQACCDSLGNNGICQQLVKDCEGDICAELQMDPYFDITSANFDEKLSEEVQELFVLALEDQCQSNAQGHLEPCHHGGEQAGDADLYIFCDNEGYVEKDGITIATYNNWQSEQKVVLTGNTKDTVVRIFCKNHGPSPGGLLATVVCEDNPQKKYVTKKSGGDIVPVDGVNGALQDFKQDEGPWAGGMPGSNKQANNARWVWDGSQNTKTIEFQFSFDGGKCGAQAGAIQPQPIVEDQPFDDEPEQFYEPEVQPFDFPVHSVPASNAGEYALELTKTDLVIILLVLANLAVVGATTYMCLSNKKQQKYSVVKSVYTTDEEEADILVE